MPANKNEHHIILKSINDKKIFVNALLYPPAPNHKLKAAQSAYAKFITKEIEASEIPR